MQIINFRRESKQIYAASMNNSGRVSGVQRFQHSAHALVQHAAHVLVQYAVHALV